MKEEQNKIDQEFDKNYAKHTKLLGTIDYRIIIGYLIQTYDVLDVFLSLLRFEIDYRKKGSSEKYKN